ncbi:MAG: hypothetical protein WAO55_13865 [Candidatus Manganitrophaceae bacterium]
MKQFEAIRDNGLFSGWTFAIAVGILLLVCVAIGKREKLRGSGKFTGTTGMIRRYGDWSRLPLSFFAILLIYAVLIPRQEAFHEPI